MFVFFSSQSFKSHLISLFTLGYVLVYFVLFELSFKCHNFNIFTPVGSGDTLKLDHPILHSFLPQLLHGKRQQDSNQGRKYGRYKTILRYIFTPLTIDLYFVLQDQSK